MPRLSSESRRKRFFFQLSELPPQLLEYFTKLDYENHFALGTWVLNGESAACVAFGRYVRASVREPRVAEPALVVVDGYQRRGLAP